MKNWEKRFLHYCQKEGFLTTAEVREIVQRHQQRIDAGRPLNILALVRRKLSWDERCARQHLARACPQTTAVHDKTRVHDKTSLLAVKASRRASITRVANKHPKRLMTREASSTGELGRGMRLGPYILKQKIGSGGMGVVYKAYHPGLDHYFAIKTLHDELISPEELRRFKREAHVAAKLRHPNIVTVHHIGESHERYYIVMDYIAGRNLADIIAQESLYPRGCLEIVRQLSDALQLAHDQGIVHRDIKPSNIMIAEVDERPYLMDFGLAAVAHHEGELTRTGTLLGSPRYMSPEQARGKNRHLDGRSDIYSLGAVLYEMLCGKPVVQGQHLMQILWRITNQTPPPPSRRGRRIAEDIDAITMKCLEKDPQQRYQSMRALGEDIQRYLRGEPITARPLRGIRYQLNCFWQHIKRNRAVSMLGLLVVLLCLGGLILLMCAGGRLSVLVTVPAPVKVHFSIDGHAIAGPLLKQPLAQGWHRIRITATDYHPLEFKVHIQAHEELQLEKKLVRCQGKLHIISSLSEIEVNLTNHQTGKTYHLVAPIAGYTLEVGDYRAVFKKHNYFAQERQIKISQSPCTLIINLTPMLCWRRQISRQADINRIYLADLDADGELELLCSTYDGTLRSLALTSYQEHWQCRHNFQRDHYPMHLQDLNRDGIPDIILGPMARFMAIDGRTHRELFHVVNWWSHGFACADTNGDGYDDFILMQRYGRGIRCYDFQTQRIRWLLTPRQIGWELNVDIPPVFIDQFHLVHGAPGRLYCLDIRKGRIIWNFWFQRGAPSRQYIPLNLKFLRPTPNRPGLLLWYVAQQGLFCLNLQTRRICWQNTYQTGYCCQMRIADIENDGHPEILLYLNQLYCLDAQTGKTRWVYDLANQGQASLIAGDFENDGQLEVVVGSHDGSLHIINATNGTLISKFQLPLPARNLMLADTDGDQLKEVLCTCTKYLYCIRPKIIKLQVAPHNRGAAGNRPAQAQVCQWEEHPLLLLPAIGDLDADGQNEIVISKRSGTIYCLDPQSQQVRWRYPKDCPDTANKHGSSESNNPSPQKNASDRERAPLGTITDPPQLVDLDNDQRPELVITSGRRVTVLGPGGQALWQHYWPQGMVQPPSFLRQGRRTNLLVLSGYPKGQLQLFDVLKRKIKWQSSLNGVQLTPQVTDLNQDGHHEILALGARFAGLRCLAARNGAVQWESNLPMNSNVKGFAFADLDHDGYQEIFVGQVGGWISCLRGRDGRALWNVHLRSGNIISVPLVRDFDGDGQLELMVLSEENDVHCLQARTGRQKWVSRMQQGNCFGTHVSWIATDLDGDRYPDLIISASFCSFYMLKGQNGKWLGATQRFGILKSNLLLTDFDRDGRQDVFFLDGSGRLTCIRDLRSYFQKIIAAPHDPLSVLEPLTYLAYLHRCCHYRAYDKLAQALAHAAPVMKGWRHVLQFYQGLVALARGQNRQALQYFQRSERLPARIFDNRFLLALAYLQDGDQQPAKALLTNLLQTSVFRFEQCRQRYATVITKSMQDYINDWLPAMIAQTKCDQQLVQAYRASLFLEKPQRARQLLALSLKYGRQGGDYQQRYQRYISQIRQIINQDQTSYHYNRLLDVLDQALTVLPRAPELLLERARLYFTSSISLDKALDDLQQCLERQPQLMAARLLRGEIYTCRQDYEHAVADFKACLDSDQKEMAYLHLAMVSWLQGRQERVQKLLQQAQLAGMGPPGGSPIVLRIYQCLEMALQGRKLVLRRLLYKIPRSRQYYFWWVILPRLLR